MAAASYEARAYGVFSAMPSVRARRLCPHAVFLPGDHAHYADVSGRVMAIFRSYTPLVEPLSLDEAFLDVTGAQRALGDGPRIGHAIRAEVLAEEGLTCSVGVAATKTVAKLASEAAKPRPARAGPELGEGVHVVPAGAEDAFLRPLPARALWGVGPATLDASSSGSACGPWGTSPTCRDDTLVRAVGQANGRHLGQLARGIDPRPVVPDQRVKSIGHEETFPADLHDPADLEREVVRMADGVAWRLRRADQAARTITIKVRFGDFRTITRSITLPVPVDDAPELARGGPRAAARGRPVAGRPAARGDGQRAGRRRGPPAQLRRRRRPRLARCQRRGGRHPRALRRRGHRSRRRRSAAGGCG